MCVRFAAVLLLIPCSLLASAAEIRGKVVSATGGEPLARVQIAVLETGATAVTASDGTFVLTNVGSGKYTLRFNAVGYRLVTVPFSFASGEEKKEFDVTLAPDNFRRTEKVEVKGDVFQGDDSPAVIKANLTSSEIRETSTVLADDPFRAIQTLPGVAPSGNNDFFAQFSVMGASFSNTSTYIDGILVPSPFHGSSVTEGATLSILTSETIEDIKLFPAAYPEKYGDAVGAALDLQTRDGSRTSPIFRATVGLADTELLGEGALGKARKGSWLASARKSYLGYLLRNRLNDTFDDISFYDGDLKLVYDLRPNQTVTFYGVGGHTLADRVQASYTLQPNDFKRGTNDFIMARVGWRWALNPHLLLDTRAAYLESPVSMSNLFNQSLENDHHAEWVAGSSVVWNWNKDHVVEGGWMARRVTDSRDTTFYNPDDSIGGHGSQNGVGWKNDGYLQQSSSLFGKRLHVTGGLRFDTAQGFDIHPVSPQVSASLQVASATQLQFGVGRYNQFDFPPNLPVQFQGCTIHSEVFQTANHYTAGVEQRIGDNSRLKVLLFDRESNFSVAFSAYDPFSNTCSQHGLESFERDYSRGAQIVLQGRSANRLSGWVGYTLTYARQANPLTTNRGRIWPPYFPALEDQRHTFNAFGSYRFTPTVHLSGKWLFGSGFPIPSQNNTIRLGNYQRLDVRSEKDWAFKRWKLALYGEVLNLTNHDNRRYFYAAQNPDGTFTVVNGQGLPITPTAGVAFEF